MVNQALKDPRELKVPAVCPACRDSPVLKVTEDTQVWMGRRARQALPEKKDLSDPLGSQDPSVQS